MKYQEALAFIHQGYAAHRRCWDLDEAYRRTRQGLHVFLRNPSKDELFVGRRGETSWLWAEVAGDRQAEDWCIG